MNGKASSRSTNAQPRSSPSPDLFLPTQLLLKTENRCQSCLCAGAGRFITNLLAIATLPSNPERRESRRFHLLTHSLCISLFNHRRLCIPDRPVGSDGGGSGRAMDGSQSTLFHSGLPSRRNSSMLPVITTAPTYCSQDKHEMYGKYKL